MKYRADVDGLRSLAVMPVVLFHAGFSVVSGGFVGVDVFFVISGFLITGILKGDLDAGRYSLLDFYERRIRRIWPALIAVIAATWLGAFILFLPTHFVDFSKSVVATVAFLSNVYFWKYSGYFDASAQLRPLLHTWSLGVEEQFYIFIPPVMWFVHRFLKKIWVPVFAVAALISLGLSIFLTNAGPTANFFLLPTRAWELLLGSLLTLSGAKPLLRTWMNSALGIAGLLLIAVPVFLYSESTPFPGLTAVPPCLGAAMLLYAGQDADALSTRLLSWMPLVWLGRISYSLYLIHWPVAVFVRYATLAAPTLVTASAVVIISVVLALLSWRFIEQPFRDRAFIPSRKLLFGIALSTGLAMAGLGVAGVIATGFPQRFGDRAAALTYEDPAAALGGGQEMGWRTGHCFFEDYAYDKWQAQACDLTGSGAPKPGEGILLWGDSYAAHYAPGITAAAGRLPAPFYEYTAAGCPPVLSYYSYSHKGCTPFNANALKVIDSLHIGTVVLSGRWTDLKRDKLGDLRSTLQALHDRSLTVYVIGQSPVFITDVKVIAARKSDGKTAEDRWPNSTAPDLNAAIADEVAAMHDPRIRFIDPIQTFCDGSQCPYRKDGKFLFFDNGHYTPDGARLAVDSYFPLARR